MKIYTTAGVFSGAQGVTWSASAVYPLHAQTHRQAGGRQAGVVQQQQAGCCVSADRVVKGVQVAAYNAEHCNPRFATAPKV